MPMLVLEINEFLKHLLPAGRHGVPIETDVIKLANPIRSKPPSTVGHALTRNPLGKAAILFPALRHEASRSASLVTISDVTTEIMTL